MYNYPRKTFVPVVILACIAACNNAPVYKKAATVLRSEAYKQSTTESLFAAPWPDDRQLNADGTVTVAHFPLAQASGLFGNVLSTAEGQLKGWGTQTPIYLPLSAALDEATLTDASVQLVVVDEQSPLYGQRAKIDWHQFTDATLYLPGPTLAVRPVPGFPLVEATKYALLLTTAVKDTAGHEVGSDESLFNALNELGTTEKEKNNKAFFAPLRAYLKKNKTAFTSIATATIFTTQPIISELQELATFLEAQPDPTPTVTAKQSETADYVAFEGTYPAPFLQFGEVPFEQTGGDFRRNADGTFQIARTEQMRFIITIPKGEVPAEGFPIVMTAHGTGGSYKSVLRIGKAHAAKGLAAVGIDQVLHGPRGPASGTCFGFDLELCFYNPVNVISGRNNTRMAAVDNVTLQKALRHLQIPTELDPEGRTIKLRTSHFGFFGHSQGGLTGSLYSTVAKDVDAFVLSGNGGWLVHTILIRTDPIDLKALAESVLLLNINGVESLDEWHPAMALVQMLAECTDPNNYARWFKGRAQPINVFMSSGLDDPYTPSLGAAQTAALAGFAPYAPLLGETQVFTGHDVTPVAAPITDTDGGTTAVFRQFNGFGHYPIFDSPEAVANWKEFLDDALHGRVPTIH